MQISLFIKTARGGDMLFYNQAKALCGCTYKADLFGSLKAFNLDYAAGGSCIIWVK